MLCARWRNEYLRLFSGRMRLNPDADSINLIDGLFGQNFVWRSITINLSATKHHKTGKEKGGEVEVMERGNDRQAMLAIELPYQLENLDLVSQIEKGGRL